MSSNRSIVPLILLSLALLPGCSASDRHPTEPPPAPVARVILPARDTAFLGEMLRVLPAIRDAEGRGLRDRAIVFETLDSSVATVDSAGLITPHLEGETTIRATSEGVTAEMGLLVAPARIAALAFRAPSIELLAGDTATTLPELTDRLGHRVERGVAWASSAPAVAIVDSAGRVTAIGHGQALISAAIDGVSGSYRVAVLDLVRPSTVVLRPATVVLLPGAEGRVWVNAADSAGRPLPSARMVFSSSDASVATVSADGVVRARAPGSALVTATVNGRSATTTVRVDASEAGAFTIGFIFQGELANDPTMQALAREAAARWERVIVGALPAQVMDYPAGTCSRNAPAMNLTTTGLVVLLVTDSLGGSTLGTGGPCVFRPDAAGYGAPAAGVVTLDSARVRRYLAEGQQRILENLIAHEIGHVLGVGTTWRRHGQPWSATGMRVGPETDYRFIGETAMAASADLGFTAPGETVPLEDTGGPGTRGAHLRASVYGRELMNGWASSAGQPLTAVTAGLLRDLGYVVQLAGADLATPPELNPSVFGPLLPPTGATTAGINVHRAREERVELRERPYDGPIYVIGRDGRLLPLRPH